ncbi:excinuclease ABC subunit B [Candidatus Falkowbacteria bacterium RIFOXYD2_FULL_35_9]|uniref:UvrABC system protein B n=1 Tax=Candidatus Falkowbacteria bacterium RIFOXYC2_FULL_36_12 TaxID=1798002 RepID=A0A1F5SXP4_9BACT|nr:MAG: excinuclease ABC subunit B [Candidatus Falkowbacteria bacterium RIFOXYC2_FULL_36_12]OGF31303.1 MAG: excinuclease ABC subunit B [Candidatus Falkowbacteria bacterium RIFOXYB2_FULL_35_7]OGF34429.1 MAG: excinuclease ABC subunit B [Candidatus Falkowbacteria bacterium RIFOXYA2_FULL_35_8]OGF45651.1 MAG: excinuclease ABC subunit B [Candidatus Falkowbacteria bacterium RIFOXYD2_FULL_35_9]
MNFKLHSNYKPAGDQPQAIDGLVSGIEKNFSKQTLLGVTGSGKTFTIANVIEKIQLPTLVIAHNKTLAAQLCNEFREFFPDNAVEYFVSYYDYYQPEAYLPNSDTYIEKEAQINQEIDRLRHACTQALITRKDVIIVASVSAIYGLGSPDEYEKVVIEFKQGQKLNRRQLMEQLVNMQYTRTGVELRRGLFRMTGQVFEVMPINEETIYRFEISDKIDKIEKIEPITRKFIEEIKNAWLFPAKHYVLNEDLKQDGITKIKTELKQQLAKFKKQDKLLEHERLKQKTRYDIEMIENIGYCNGIENYSRHFDGRSAGQPPYTLLDYFKYGTRKFLTVIDESHVTIPQIRAMYNGDKARKDSLINFGFRMPSARDNRPLTYDEFNAKTDFTIYTTATPNDYELNNSKQIVEQIVRPTGLVDPAVIIRPITESKNHPSQIQDLISEIDKQIKKKERTLVTTLTKKMAEDLSDYLKAKNIKVSYLHSDIDTLERIEILTELRKGSIDVLIGVNLLREGLDIPEVSLVAILDADKEGFLRSETSLIQTIGRAARNANGRVILYADQITGSIKNALSETDRRRKKQLAYNKKNNITPKTIEKNIRNILEEFGLTVNKNKKNKNGKKQIDKILQLELKNDTRPIEKIIAEKETAMRQAAKDLEFELASILRDEIKQLNKKRSKRKK